MAFILPIEEPWTSQPQVEVGIDWSNPLARWLSNALGMSGRDLVSGEQWTLYNGACNPAVTDKGVALDFTGAGFFSAPFVVPNAYTVTIAALVNPSANGFVLSLSKTGGYDHCAIFFDSANGYLAYLRDGGGTTHGYSETGQSRVNKWAVVILSMDQQYDGGSSPSFARFWIDGVLVWSGNWTWGAVAPDRKSVGATVYMFGGLPSGSGLVTAKIISPRIFRGYFSDVDAKSLTDKYWQIFAP